ITIEDHIVKLYECNKKIDFDRLNYNDDIFYLICNTINKLKNPSKLRVIKDKLPKNISYLHIKLALARIKKEGNNKDQIIKNMILEHSKKNDNMNKRYKKIMEEHLKK